MSDRATLPNLDADLTREPYDEPSCPDCGEMMEWENCEQIGCDDGYITDLHDLDPLWYDEDDEEICDLCAGKGGWWLCTDKACREEKP